MPVSILLCRPLGPCNLTLTVKWPLQSGHSCTAVQCAALPYHLLHCIALFCNTLPYIALRCTVLHFTYTNICCTALHCSVINFTVFNCSVLNFTALYCFSLHWTALFFSGAHLATVHCSDWGGHWCLCISLSHHVEECHVAHCSLILHARLFAPDTQWKQRFRIPVTDKEKFRSVIIYLRLRIKLNKWIMSFMQCSIIWISLQISYFNALNKLLQHITAMHYTLLYCTTLYCTAQHIITLHYTLLHCNTNHCTALPTTSLHYTQLHFTTPQRTALETTALHYNPTALHYRPLQCTTHHCTTLHCTTLHCTVPQWVLTITADSRCWRRQITAR